MTRELFAIFFFFSGEGPPLDDGYIEPSKPRDEVRQEPYPLPKDFEWTTLDIEDPEQVSHITGIQRFRQTYSLCRTRKSTIFCRSTMWKMITQDSDFNIVLSSSHGESLHWHKFEDLIDVLLA